MYQWRQNVPNDHNIYQLDLICMYIPNGTIWQPWFQVRSVLRKDITQNHSTGVVTRLNWLTTSAVDFRNYLRLKSKSPGSNTKTFEITTTTPAVACLIVKDFFSKCTRLNAALQIAAVGSAPGMFRKTSKIIFRKHQILYHGRSNTT
jgi:hypothetical protein